MVLGIMVLSFLWCNVSFAEILKFECKQVKEDTHEYINYTLNTDTKEFITDLKWKDEYYKKYYGSRIKKGETQIQNIKRVLTYFSSKEIRYSSKDGQIKFKFNYGGDLKAYAGFGKPNQHFLNCSKIVDIAEKPKKEKPKKQEPKDKIFNWGEPICVNLNQVDFLSNAYPCKGDVVNKYNTAYEYYFDLLSQTHKVAGKPGKKKKPKTSPDDDKIVPAGSGSGFFVLKDGTVITNYHVIEGCELNKVSYRGSQSEAKVLSIDKVNDIAILKTDINPQNAFSVSNEDVSLLEDVIVAGYPLGKQISSAIKTHKGVVTALAGAGDNYSYFQTDAAINQGNSGGPIINQKGNVVGIAVQTWVEEGVQGVHFGIKSSTLKTFASANGLKFLIPNNRDLSNKELGKLITESTVYVECHMTIAKIKKMLAEMENKKAFFKEHK